MHPLPPLAQLLTDARIAALLAAPAPALVIDADGKLCFANLAALSLLGARTLRDAIASGPAELGPIPEAARRLMASLPPGGPARRERLQLPPAGTQSLVFACSRIALVNGDSAILFAGEAGEAKAPELSDAAAALFDGESEALALFDGAGGRIHANPAATALLGPARSLTEIVSAASGALATARSEGKAELSFGMLRILLRRIETGIAPAVLAVFAGPAKAEATEPAASGMAARSVAAPEVAAPVEPVEPVESTPAAAPVETPAPIPPAQTSRLPTRFVWQTDAEGRFTSVSPELATVVGNESAAIAGLDWEGAGTRLGIVNAEAVAAAIAGRDTWSGVTVLWPIDASELVRPVDLAALPVFDRERRFLGYRGFGVFREPVERPAPAKTRAAPAPRSEKPHTPAQADERLTVSPPPALEEIPQNVVRLRSTPAAGEQPRPALTSVERTAFREIARVIGLRLKRVDVHKTASGAPSDTAAPSPSAEAAPKPGAISSSLRYLENGERAVLDRLPIGVVVHRGEEILYANRTLLDWIGLANAQEFSSAGGLNRLFAGTPDIGFDEASDSGRPLALSGRGGEPIPVEVKLLSVPWEG
ncbi:MAG: hypothetical protein Q7S17_04005, partial [Xanthobacteraceae bacterium]|nr:hypothetical protein [Xanthobacteraceae bacterium]